MFGLLISDERTGKPSKIHFGGYDQSIIDKANTKIDPNFKGDKSKVLDKTEDGIFWLNVHSNDHWEVNGYEGYVGDKELSVSWSKVFFDSGSSHTWIPESNYYAIIDKFKENHVCEKRLYSNDNYVCSCTG